MLRGISDFRKYNLFVLISTLARNMIEIFIPIYLYKYGFSLEEVFLYFLFVLLISFIICWPAIILGQKIKYKNLMLVSLLFFVLTYYLLSNVIISDFYLIILSLCYSFYRRFYWISKRYYALKIVPEENMGSKVSSIVIVTEVGAMLSIYVGGLILNYSNNMILFLISIVLYIISVYPLFNIKIDEEQVTRIDFSQIKFKEIKGSNVILMILNEAIFIINFIFALYIFLYVKNNFAYIGIFNIFVGIASLISIYFFSRKMDKNKKDYKHLSTLGLFLVFILKLQYNFIFVFLLFGLLEGIFKKMYDVSHTRNIYFLGTHFKSNTYNLFIELIQNFSRLFIFGCLLLITNDLKLLILICAILILMMTFFKFDDGEGGYI